MANSHMTFGVDLLPRTTNTYSLGNSSQKWKIYVNSINDVSDLHFTDTTYTFDGTYNASTNKAATVSTVTNAISNLGAAAQKAVDTTIADSSASTNLPTSAAVASFVEGKGYNTGLSGIYFVKGTHTAAVAAWTGNLPEVDALYDGLTIAFYSQYATAASTTLTLTLSSTTTAAEPVYLTSTTRLGSQFGAGSTVFLTWMSNATTGYAAVGSAIGRWTRADYYVDEVAHLVRLGQVSHIAANITYRYQLLFETASGQLTPLTSTNNSTATTKTVLTSQKFNPNGNIYYYNSTTTVNADAAYAKDTLYMLAYANVKYSFNTSDLVVQKPVYLRVALQNDGYVVLASTTPIVQTLPTSADGYLYIYLGHAYNTTTICLSLFHQVYYYYNGKINQYIPGTYPGRDTLTAQQREQIVNMLSVSDGVLTSQPDWTMDTPTNVSYILHKPHIMADFTDIDSTASSNIPNYQAVIDYIKYSAQVDLSQITYTLTNNEINNLINYFRITDNNEVAIGAQNKAALYDSTNELLISNNIRTNRIGLTTDTTSAAQFVWVATNNGIGIKKLGGDS